MEATKILFTDLDGTLLNSKREISAQNKAAIKKALDGGNKIVISTGRPLPSALLLVKQLGLIFEGCYAITYNGGLIYDCFNNEAVFKATVPIKYIRHIFDTANEFGVHCHTYSKEFVVSEKLTRELEHYCNAIKVSYKLVDNIEQLNEEPVKAVMIDRNGRDRLSKIQDSLSAWCTDKVNSHFSSSSLLEFGPLLASKGSAVEFLCSHLNIPMENSIAVGDEENDISMLKAAHVGAVMKNASADIKEYADYITENDNNNNGVAEVINKFML